MLQKMSVPVITYLVDVYVKVLFITEGQLILSTCHAIDPSLIIGQFKLHEFRYALKSEQLKYPEVAL